jgi:hypothetical protein
MIVYFSKMKTKQLPNFKPSLYYNFFCFSLIMNISKIVYKHPKLILVNKNPNGGPTTPPPPTPPELPTASTTAKAPKNRPPVVSTAWRLGQPSFARRAKPLLF